MFQDAYDQLGRTVSRPQPPPPQPGGYGRVVTGGPRVAPPQAPSQDAQNYGSAAASAANANRTRALTPLDARGQQLQNDALNRDLTQGASPQQVNQNELGRYRADIEALTAQLQHVGDLYNRNFRDNDPMITLGLSPTEREFDAAAAQLRQQAQGTFRIPGTGDMNAQEVQQLADAFALDSRNWDSRNEELLNGITNRLNARRQALGLDPVDWRQAQLTAVQRADPNRVQPGESMGQVGTLPNVPNQNGGGHNELDNNGGLYVTAQDRAEGDRIAGHANAMIHAGRSAAEVDAYLVSQGRQRMDGGFADTIERFRRRGQFRQHPGFSPTYVPTGRSDPNLTTGMANSGIGAGVIASGDAMTFGLLDNLTSNPERTRAGMELLREAHPGASVVGEMAGSLLPGAGAERLAAAGIRGLGRGVRYLRGAEHVEDIARLPGELRTIGEMAERPAGNALYGGAYGYGSADQPGDNRWLGALRGAGMSVAGGEVGDRAVAGFGRGLTGVRNAGTRYLAERGIPLTIGDIGAGGGVFGRGVSRVQNVMESVPFLGDAIRGRRTDSRAALNRAAFDDALAPVGANTGGRIGEEGSQLASAAVSDAYSSALDNVKVRADQPFARALDNVHRLARNLPDDLQGHYSRFIRNRVEPALRSGQMTGSAYQALRQDIQQELSAISGQLGERDYGVVLRRTDAALSGMLRRQSPQTRAALRAADQAYRRTSVLKDAVGRAVNNPQPGMFTPAQLGQSARTNATRYGGNAATTSRPFFRLQREAQKVLPSSLPNSGTADRAWVLQTFMGGGAALAGGAAYQAGYLNEKTAALFAALGLPYTRTGQRAFQKMLMDRPDIVRAAGETIISGRRWGARAGAGAVNPLTDQTPSPTGR